LQETSTPLYASLHASLAGFPGRPRRVIALDDKTARKVPKGMGGRMLSQSEAEALLRRFGA